MQVLDSGLNMFPRRFMQEGQARATTDIRAAPGFSRSLARSTSQSTGAVASNQGFVL
jgi:hypothetical protein